MALTGSWWGERFTLESKKSYPADKEKSLYMESSGKPFFCPICHRYEETVTTTQFVYGDRGNHHRKLSNVTKDIWWRFTVEPSLKIFLVTVGGVPFGWTFERSLFCEGWELSQKVTFERPIDCSNGSPTDCRSNERSRRSLIIVRTYHIYVRTLMRLNVNYNKRSNGCSNVNAPMFRRYGFNVRTLFRM